MSIEVFDNEILSTSMWAMYREMKDDEFNFKGFSSDDKNLMINHILPYFESIEEFEICEELKQRKLLWQI